MDKYRINNYTNMLTISAFVNETVSDGVLSPPDFHKDNMLLL